MNIYQKLVEVRKSVTYLQKESKGHQYNYVSSSQVLTSLREKMDELNLLLVPKVLDTNVLTEVVEGKKDGEVIKKTTTYFTELKMEFVWINADNPDETIVCPWYGQGVDIAGEKGVGKAMTYAEKYFLLKMFNIATDKDDPDSHQQVKGKKATYETAKETFDEMDVDDIVITDDDMPKQNSKLDVLNINCENCNAEMNQAQLTMSKHKFGGRALCPKCQKEVS